MKKLHSLCCYPRGLRQQTLTAGSRESQPLRGCNMDPVRASALRARQRDDRNGDEGERGSAIIWIMIAVALFGALGFAFSQGSRSSVNLLTQEQAQTYAKQVVAYGNDVRQAVKRLRLRGCDDTEISFENNIATTPPYHYTNGTNTNCFVFHSDGGGLTFKIQPNDLLDSSQSGYLQYGEPVFSGNTRFQGIGSDCANSTCNELFMIIPYVQDSVCKKINKIVGVENPSGSIPEDDGSFGVETFKTGSLFKYEANHEVHDTANEAITGKNQGCFFGNHDPGPAGNHYFMILISR